ncbi:MAG: hypothetical protein NC541_07985 [bacterium]|nr:hypothetical protein [bacterium]
MISNLKLGFRILKFGLNYKSTVISGIIVSLIGIALCFLQASMTEDGTIPGGYFLALTAMFMVQLLYTCSMSDVIQASPMKKKLQTSVPAVMSVFCMICGYSALLLTEGVAAALWPDAMGSVCEQILFSAVVIGCLMLYMGAAYKYFFVSSALFMAMFFLTFGYYANRSRNWLSGIGAGSWRTFGLVGAAGFAAILICGVLQYLLSLAVYKAPMSKRALAGALRRQQ